MTAPTTAQLRRAASPDAEFCRRKAVERSKLAKQQGLFYHRFAPSPMPVITKLRRALQPTLAALVLTAAALTVTAQPVSGPKHQAAYQSHVGPKPNQEHLAQWMDRHSNLPLAEQQKELEKEPGFRDLPPQTQQRMRDRLTQLNNMPPEQRRRILERTEVMEHLTPPQRQQVRS